jgi:ubiquinol-cytochrome c reductase cytochrome b subunit
MVNQKNQGWLEKRLPIKGVINKIFGDYPVPKRARYWAIYGWLAIILFFVVLKTGVFLSMHYMPSNEGAFASVQHIVRNVNYGWLIRSMHANGASFLFLLVYIHLLRSIYYRSYRKPREIAWISGVIALMFMMACAFTGYVLVWGQMSYWAATVITNLFSEIPFVGEQITETLRGGASLGTATLKRFYSLHFMMPISFLFIGLIHIWSARAARRFKLQEKISRTPKGYVPFHPYYTSKIFVGFGVLICLYMLVSFYFPDALNNPDNNIEANRLVTPAHLAPEWYFLPFYGILRAVSNPLGGVVLMFGSLIVLFFVPWLDSSKRRTAKMRKIFNICFFLLIIDCVLLGFAGKMPAIGAWLIVGKVATIYYFSFFLILLPLLKIKGDK